MPLQGKGAFPISSKFRLGWQALNIQFIHLDQNEQAGERYGISTERFICDTRVIVDDGVDVGDT